MITVTLMFGTILGAVLLFPRAVAAAVDSGVPRLQQLLASITVIMEKIISAIVDRVRHAGGVSPIAMLAGVLVAVAAVPIARSEFEVIRRSLLLVWPDEIASDRVALSLVLMTFAIGLLTHAIRGRALRLVIGCGAVSLTIMAASLAYYRTIEIEKISLATEDFSATPLPESGTLAIGGHTESPNVAITAPVRSPEPDRLPAVIAAALALLLSLGGIIVGYGALSLGGSVLIALLAFPMLVILVAASAATRLSNIALAALISTTPSFIEACLSRWAALARLIKNLFPASWTAEADAWRRARASRDAAFAKEISEREETVHLSRLERGAESSYRERYREFVFREEERDLQHMSEALEASRKHVTQAHHEGIQELLNILAAERHEFYSATVRDALRNLRAPAAVQKVISMLFWPLDRVWRVVEENRGYDSSNGRQPQSTAGVSADSASTKGGF